MAGWSGLRWGELRALRVNDMQELPTPALHVRRSQTEGKKVKVTKGKKSRRVPLADLAFQAVRRLASGKAPNDLLVTGARGGQLWRGCFTRVTGWESLTTIRLHDLRHTAACIRLARGMDLSTVSAWLGHASVTTTDRYLHHLGNSADAAGLALLNAKRGASGAHKKGKIS